MIILQTQRSEPIFQVSWLRREMAIESSQMSILKEIGTSCFGLDPSWGRDGGTNHRGHLCLVGSLKSLKDFLGLVVMELRHLMRFPRLVNLDFKYLPPATPIIDLTWICLEKEGNRWKQDANRHHFRIYGRFSAVNRRQCRRVPARERPENLTPKFVQNCSRIKSGKGPQTFLVCCISAFGKTQTLDK